MRFKRLLALLVSAALALSLLAGCGGGKALSQVIVDLLDGLYSNVSVEADSDLTAALKQAAAEGGTEEEILSRMIEILNHKGGSITFTRLGSGQQGNHAVTLYFQTGTDPDAAARNALAKWAGTLGTLPDDGSYQADVAMIETENGYYIALDVEVLKAGTPDKPDQSDADDDNHLGYTENSANNYTVSTAQGFDALVTLKQEDIASTSITLDCDVTLPENWPDSLVYTASFDGGNHTVSGVNGNGMFDEVASGASVKNVNFANVAVSSSGSCGTVTAINNGTLDNCHVLSGRVSGGNTSGRLVGYNENGTISNSSTACNVDGSSWVSGIAGENAATITNCKVTGDITGSGKSIGGVVGYNSGTISECVVSGNIKGTGTATDSDAPGSYIGGVSGGNDGTISYCTSTGNIASIGDSVGGISGDSYGSITYSSSSGNIEGSNNVGGVVGYNGNDVTACYSTGAITGTSTNTTCQVGGVAGGNYGTVDSCYAQGSVTSRSSHGFVGGVVGINSSDTSSIKGCYSSCAVTGSIDVGGVAGASNGSILGCFATGTITSIDSATTGGLVGEVYKGMVQGCYWSNDIQNGAGADQYQVGGITKIGSQSTDGLVTWGNAVTSMNAASGASVKFVNNDTSVPTLPIS